jgi:hypothetical protein
LFPVSRLYLKERFQEECQAQGNTLDLWAAYHRLPIGQAAQSLAETFAPRLDITRQIGHRGTRKS